MKTGIWWLVAVIVIILVVGLFVSIQGNSLSPQSPSVTTAEDPNQASTGAGVLICHQDRNNLLPNFNAEANSTLPLVQSAAIALKGVNEAIKTQLNDLQVVNAVSVVSAFVLPGFASSQLVNATCSTVDKNGVAMCEDEMTSAVFGLNQKTEVAPDGTYVRSISRDGKETVVEGKKGDPSYIVVNTEDGRTVWQRDRTGLETLTTDSANGTKTTVSETPDCSGSLSANTSDGTSIVSNWSYLADNKTTGSLTVSSPNPNLNFSINW